MMPNRSRRLPLKSSAGEAKPARTGHSTSGRTVGDAVTGTGRPDKRLLLYVHTVHSGAQAWVVTLLLLGSAKVLT